MCRWYFDCFWSGGGLLYILIRKVEFVPPAVEHSEGFSHLALSFGVRMAPLSLRLCVRLILLCYDCLFIYLNWWIGGGEDPAAPAPPIHRTRPIAARTSPNLFGQGSGSPTPIPIPL